MKFVPVENLKPQMILGQDIHDASGRLLLAKFSELSTENISYISFLGAAGVYIEDKAEPSLEGKGVISDEVRTSAVKMVQNVFGLEEGQDLSAEEAEIRAMVAAIVDAILNNGNVMDNLLTVKLYDGYTYFHSVDVAVLSGVLAAKCKLPEETIKDIVTAGFLHDIGKIKINLDLLNASYKISDYERSILMKHSEFGYQILKDNFNFNEEIMLTVYQHHEWYNGSGYPNHIDSKEILLNSRILKCADVYDAMVTKRPYHDAYLPSEVIEYIMSRSGMEFDPKVVETMCAELSIYPVGCEVVLSDGRHGVVVANHKGNVSRPTLRMIDNGQIYNMLDDRSTFNTTIVKLMM